MAAFCLIGGSTVPASSSRSLLVLDLGFLALIVQETQKAFWGRALYAKAWIGSAGCAIGGSLIHRGIAASGIAFCSKASSLLKRTAQIVGAVI